MTIPYNHHSKKASEVALSRLEAVMQKRGFGGVALIDNWKSVVGEEIGSKCLPVKFARKEKIFYLHSKDLEFRAYFKYSKGVILERLRLFFGHGAVEGVKLMG